MYVPTWPCAKLDWWCLWADSRTTGILLELLLFSMHVRTFYISSKYCGGQGNLFACIRVVVLILRKQRVCATFLQCCLFAKGVSLLCDVLAGWKTVWAETGQLEMVAVVSLEKPKRCRGGVKVQFVLVVTWGPQLWFRAFSLLCCPKKVHWGTVAMVLGVTSCVNVLWTFHQLDSLPAYLLLLR